MDEEIKSKIKYSIIMSIIGMSISLIFLIFEIINKRDIIFWSVILICNLIVLITSIVSYKKN